MAHQIIHRAAIITGGGGSINPWDIPGLELMLHAPYEGGNEPAELSGRAQNPGITDGALIATATDWSGMGNHPTEGSTSRQPTWDNTGDGFVYTFDGSHILRATGIRGTDGGYVVAAVTKGDFSNYLWYWGVPFGNPLCFAFLGPASSNLISIKNTNTAARTGTYGTFVSMARVNWLWDADNQNQDVTRDDVSLLTPDVMVTATPFDSSHNLDIGGFNGATSYRGNIGSLFWFHTRPSDDDIAALNTWLDAQWSL